MRRAGRERQYGFHAKAQRRKDKSATGSIIRVCTAVPFFCAAGMALALVGCAPQNRTLIEAFPPARVATPWVLEGQVWAGSFDDAAPGLGEDADAWGEFRPTRVWLARYTHEDRPQRVLTVRCLAFETPQQARRAYEKFAPLLARAFDGGDEGCWTGVGVLVRYGALVIEVFGPKQTFDNEVQSSLIASYMIRRMPPGLPDAPR